MARRLETIALMALLGCASVETARLDEGKALYQEGRYEPAIAKLSQLINDEPSNAEAHYLRASARLLVIGRDGVLQDSNLNQILNDLDRAIDLAPDEYWYYYSRAMALAVMARYREAVQDLLVTVQSKDRVLTSKAHRRLAQIYDEKFEDMQAMALRHYELYLQMGGDDREAMHRCTELKKLELERPSDVPKEESQLKDLDRAAELVEKREFAHAVDLLTKIISDPAVGKDRLKEAREVYVRARVALEGEQKANALYETASSMIREGKIEPAKAILEEIINKFPSSEAAKTKAPALLLKLMNKEN